MKKIIGFILVLCLLISGSAAPVYAISDEEFEKNEDYYRTLCSQSQLTTQEKTTCRDFAYYISKQSETLRKELARLDAEKETIAENMAVKAQEIQKFNAEISVLAADITALNNSIGELQVQIDMKIVEITEKEIEVLALRAKVLARMEKSQGTMRFNQYIDYFMGATSLEDLIRKVNGVNDIMAYDDQVRIELKDLIEYLNGIKAQLEVDKGTLEVQKKEVVEKQNLILAKRHEAELIIEEGLKREAEIEAEGNKIAGNLKEIQSQLAAMAAEIDGIPSSTGFSKPMSGGRVSANTWHYPSYSGSLSGGTHLGMDLAGSVGTEIKAVANGVIIKAVDGCGNNGYLGNVCGGAQGGTSGGGNQVIQLSSIDGILYAIKYLHLSPGLSVSESTVVSAGQKIGGLGGSGNVTGPHLHIEIYKLGTSSINSYINSWDGNLSFGCGWGTSALNRICENSGAPCRLRPETMLGY